MLLPEVESPIGSWRKALQCDQSGCRVRNCSGTASFHDRLWRLNFKPTGTATPRVWQGAVVHEEPHPQRATGTDCLTAPELETGAAYDSGKIRAVSTHDRRAIGT
ncbi:hypothetical protein TNCV_4425961 [Trichonephila clavipes]|nr:hypothetical protein TNCV_4425961 [Trichonephila clavipes]